MQARELFIRCLLKREDDHWVAICLDFDLVAQASSQQEARQKLEAQIVSYVRDAMFGQDHQHADYLLHRRAPLRYWLEYAYAVARNKLRNVRAANSLRGYREVLPLAPAC